MTDIQENLFRFMFIDEDIFYLEDCFKRNDIKRANYHIRDIKDAIKKLEEFLKSVNEKSHSSEQDKKDLNTFTVRLQETISDFDSVMKKYEKTMKENDGYEY